MQLTAVQRQQLHKALISAFPTTADLHRLVSFGLGESLYLITNVSSDQTLTSTTLDLMRWAIAHDRVLELIQAARQENPSNSALTQIAREVGLVGQLTDYADYSPIPNNLPSEPDIFLDRDFEQHRILNALIDEDVPVVILEGKPGVGKTALARRIGQAALKNHAFVGGICWLDCRNIPTMIDLEALVRSTFRLTSRGDIWTYLNQRSSLLIFDGYDEAQQDSPVEPFVRRLLLKHPKSKVLITMRGGNSSSTQLHIAFRNSLSLVLADLPSEAGNQLFTTIVQRREPLPSDSAKLVREIVSLVGGNPALIQLFAANLPPSTWPTLQAALSGEAQITPQHLATLSDIADYLPDSIGQQIHSIASALPNPDQRAAILTLLITKMPESDRNAVASQAIQAALEIPYAQQRLDRLVALAAYLDHSLIEEILAEIEHSVNPTRQVLALLALLPSLTTRTQRNRATEAALYAAHDIGDEVVRTAALQDLLPYISPSLMVNAFSSVKDLQEPALVISLLASFTPHVLSSQVPLLLKTVQQIKDKDTQAIALGEMAALVTTAERDLVLRETLILLDTGHILPWIKGVIDGLENTPELERKQVSEQLLLDILQLLTNTTSEEVASQVLVLLAHRFSSPLFLTAVDVARNLKQVDQRNKALVALIQLSQQVPSTEREQIEAELYSTLYRAELARGIENHYLGASSENNIIQTLTEPWDDLDAQAVERRLQTIIRLLSKDHDLSEDIRASLSVLSVVGFRALLHQEANPVYLDRVIDICSNFLQNNPGGYISKFMLFAITTLSQELIAQRMPMSAMKLADELGIAFNLLENNSDAVQQKLSGAGLLATAHVQMLARILTVIRSVAQVSKDGFPPDCYEQAVRALTIAKECDKYEDLEIQLADWVKTALPYEFVELEDDSWSGDLVVQIHLAHHHENDQNWSEAIKAYERARSLVNPTENDHELTRYTKLGFHMGVCLRRCGRWSEALKQQRENVAAYKKLRDFCGNADAYLEIGHIYQLMNIYDPALLHYGEAYYLYQELTGFAADEKARRFALGGLANAVEALGDLEFNLKIPKARVHLEEAAALYSELGRPNKAEIIQQTLKSMTDDRSNSNA